jgi:hypothetical protein
MSQTIDALQELAEAAIAHDEALVARLKAENARLRVLLREGYARVRAHCDARNLMTDGDAVWINAVVDLMLPS